MSRRSMDADVAPPERARGKALASKSVANDTGDAPAFTLTSGQLVALVRQAVADELAKGHAGPQLVNKENLAKRLSCSAAHIDNLRKRGLPVVMLGDGVRFDPAVVISWLQQQREES
jgi:hypothetical protein